LIIILPLNLIKCKFSLILEITEKCVIVNVKFAMLYVCKTETTNARVMLS